MAYALGLPDALRRRGLRVEVVPGWETRSAGSFNPKGAVAHWTAGPRGSTGRPSLNVVTYGRPGLDGPLCNVYGARNGVAVVVAAGRANHAGVGSWRGLVGNSSVFGTEMEGADAADFTAEQRWAYPRINAAYCDLGCFGPDMVCGHSEWAGPRKTDINGYTMADLRRDIAAVLAGEDDMPTPRDLWEHQIATDEGVFSAEVLLRRSFERTGGIPRAVIDGLLDAPLDRSDIGLGETTLRQILRWSDPNTDRVLNSIAAATAAASGADPQKVAEQVRAAVAGELSSLRITVAPAA